MNKFLEILKSIFNNIQSILIVILVIVILLMRECDGGNSNGGGKIDTTIIETVKWDTLRIPEITYVPKWRTKIVTEHDTIPRMIDTGAILKDYYSKYYYSDTIEIDTIGNIVINDTITQNKIFARTPKVSIAIPTITKEITINNYINNRELYYGFGVQGNTSGLNFLGGDLLYRTKKKTAYGLSVGINQNFAPVVGGRMYWKLGK